MRGNVRLNPARSYLLKLSKKRAQLKLLVLALVSMGLYLALAIKFPLGSSLENPRASWLSLVGGDLPWIGFQILIYFCLFWLYTISMRMLQSTALKSSPGQVSHARSSRGQILVIVLAWLAFSAILLTSAAAGESHDIFDYVFRGRMMVEYQANPLVELPKAYDRAHFYLYTAWYHNVDTYGPIWEMASAGISGVLHLAAPLFGGAVGSLPSCPESAEACRWLVIYLSGYRLFAILLTGLSALIISKIVRGSQPALVPAALAAWLWNPLTLLSSAVGGHNDFLMLVFILACFLLMQRRKYFFALLALVLAVHVKLTALIWAPMLFFWMVRKLGWRSAVYWSGLGLAAGLAISWVLYLPFSGWGSLPHMLDERTRYYANSVWRVAINFVIGKGGWFAWVAIYLIHNLPNWLSLAGAVIIPFRAFKITYMMFRGVLGKLQSLFPKTRNHAAALPMIMNAAFKPGPVEDQMADDRRLWWSATAVSLFYLIAGAYWFQHWYLLWVLAPAALLVNRRFGLKINPWLGFGALTANFLGGFILGSAAEGIQRNLAYLLIVVIIWIPGLTAYLVTRHSSQPISS